MDKEKKKYDFNGRWTEEKTRVKGAIRRIFRLSPQMKDALYSARVELPPATKKDGNLGKKNQVRYKCAVCGGLFSRKHIQIDHLDPVVPLWKNESEMTYDELVRRIICDVENLQAICSTPLKENGGKPSCHKIKTDKENFIRNYLSNFDLNVRFTKISEAESAYVAYAEKKRIEKEEKEKRRILRKGKKKS